MRTCAKSKGLDRGPCRFSLPFVALSAIHPLARALGPPHMPTKPLTRSQPKKSSTTAVAGYRVNRGVALPLGATLRRTGVNLAVFSKYATSCTLVLLQPAAEHPFVEYPLDPHSNRTGQVWHAFIQGLDAGMQYGFRFDMQPNPNPVVHRFDPSHVLLDPYARVLSNGGAWGQYPPGKRPYRNSVVVENDFDWGDDQPLNIPLVESIIYEAHVRSFTEHPSSGVAHRGTYAGLIEKIPYLSNWE